MVLGKLATSILACALVGALDVPAFALDAEVERGIQEVENGDYDAAIVRLDVAAKRLSGKPDKAEDLGRAYLYLGIAYVGKGHEAAARARFRQAVRELRDLSLSSEQFPPKVIGIFEAAREEELRLESAGPPAPPEGGQASPAAAGPNRAGPAEAVAGKKGGKKKWLFIGGGVLAGGAIAGAASKKEPSGPTPTVTARREPPGTAIAGVTEINFSAVATGFAAPSYTWAFGDGASAVGQNAPHVYPDPGGFTATVTASGGEDRASASVGVDVRDVNGRWEARAEDFVLAFALQQRGSGVVGVFTFDSLIDGVWVRTERGVVSGDLVNPRIVHLRENGRCRSEFDGEVNESLENMVGVLCRPTCPAPETGQTCWEGSSLARAQ